MLLGPAEAYSPSSGKCMRVHQHVTGAHHYLQDRWEICAVERIHQSWTVLIRRIPHQLHLNLYWIDNRKSRIMFVPQSAWKNLENKMYMLRINVWFRKSLTISWKRDELRSNTHDNCWNTVRSEAGTSPLPTACSAVHVKGSLATHNKRLKTLTPFKPTTLLLSRN